jgi:hypothetical protein
MPLLRNATYKRSDHSSNWYNQYLCKINLKFDQILPGHKYHYFSDLKTTEILVFSS